MTKQDMPVKITFVLHGKLLCGAKVGGIAQLGERLNGIQEVTGSIPVISTKRPET